MKNLFISFKKTEKKITSFQTLQTYRIANDWNFQITLYLIFDLRTLINLFRYVGNERIIVIVLQRKDISSCERSFRDRVDGMKFAPTTFRTKK